MRLFDSIRERIKYWCVSDDEIIITQDKYEKIIGEKTYWYSRFSDLFDEFKKFKEEQELNEKLKKHILEGESETTTGIIVEYPSDVSPRYSYRKGNSRRIVQSSLENLQKFKEAFSNTGYDLAQWDTIKKELQIGYYNKKKTVPKLVTSSHHIYPRKSGSSYQIQIHSYSFGSCPSLEKAIEVRDYLEYREWDRALTSVNLCKSQRPRGDDYYLTMRAIMEGDMEYQEYIKNKEA